MFSFVAVAMLSPAIKTVTKPAWEELALRLEFLLLSKAPMLFSNVIVFNDVGVPSGAVAGGRPWRARGLSRSPWQVGDLSQWETDRYAMQREFGDRVYLVGRGKEMGKKRERERQQPPFQKRDWKSWRRQKIRLSRCRRGSRQGLSLKGTGKSSDRKSQQQIITIPLLTIMFPPFFG